MVSRWLLVVVCVGMLVSCREEAFIQLDTTQSAVSFVSTLSPESAIQADILPTLSLSNTSKTISPDKVRVLFSGSDLPSKQTAMVYRDADKKFVLRSYDFRPSPGETYEIMAYVPDMDIDTIYARTHIPRPMSIVSADVLSMSKINTGNNESIYRLTVSIKVGRPTIRPAYFQIVPRRKVSTYRTDENGDVRITNTTESKKLQIDKIASASNGISRYVHEEGIIVDYSRMRSEPILLELSTPEPLNSQEEILRLLEIDINTWSEELYLYHKSLNKQIINSNGAYSSPISSYSNVKNGHGVLGAYSTRTSTVEIVQ